MYNSLDLSNYATDLKNATGIDASKFSKKADVASLKLEIYKLDIDKLETAPIDWSSLSDVIKNENIKKAVYNELVKINLMLFRLLILVI